MFHRLGTLKPAHWWAFKHAGRLGKAYLGHKVQPARLKIVIPKNTFEQRGEAPVEKAAQVVPARDRHRTRRSREPKEKSFTVQVTIILTIWQHAPVAGYALLHSSTCSLNGPILRMRRI